MRVLHLDYESYSPVDLLKCGAHRYAEEAEIIMVQYAFDQDPVRVIDVLQGEEIPTEFIDALKDPTVLKKAANAAFERIISKACLGIDCPPEQWRCTLVHASGVGLPGSLSKLTEVMRLGDKGKDKGGRALITKFCKPCKPTKKNGQRTRNLPEHFPDDWERFKSYGHDDVIAEREVDRRISRYPLPDVEWRMWNLDQRINDRGVRVDVQLVTNAIKLSNDLRDSLFARAQEITNLENPNSRDQLIRWLDSEDVVTTSLTKKDVEQLIGSTTNEKVQELLSLRQQMAKASVKKYQAVARAICRDGRLRGTLRFNGAGRTSRWAGQIFQPQNLPSKGLVKDVPFAREIVKHNPDLATLLFNDVAQMLSSLLRPVLEAEELKTYVDADFNAIEARILAFLANESWRVELFDKGLPLYETSAEKMFNLPAGSVGKKDPIRQKGKVAELALGYQGWEGALITMGALDMGLLLEELAPICKAWRLANPAIESYWYACESAALKAVRTRTKVDVLTDYQDQAVVSYESDGNYLWANLPSGRRMYYAKPKIGSNDRGKMAVSYEGIDGTTKTWGRRWLYGGLLVENLCQAIARDCLREALLSWDEEQQGNGDIVLHVHDQVIIETPLPYAEEAKKAIEEIMGRKLKWWPELQLKGDGFVSAFFMKED